VAKSKNECGRRVTYHQHPTVHQYSADGKVARVMKEFKEGTLRSGSKKGPEVTSKKQAVAIALSEARKAGEKVPKKD